MEIYLNDLDQASHAFIGLLPQETLSRMASVGPVRAIRVNRRMRKFVGRKANEAGASFLERIHNEIFDARPQWERDAILKDLEALSSGDDIEVAETTERPELTIEYVKSIGREDMAYW